ncbi:unnamed protein product [Diabrotica balteata]|uniref:Transmembrane protein 107 n=1 Tax=Diabrotica balteata TaxID=107213 RepID=A0A9N9SX79_DIABA|nr:unnamed protein product [Diabrotica balteata]
MYNSSGLIPARFLILVAHFIICVTLLWNKEESVSACLMGQMHLELEKIHGSYLTQWVTGLSLMITFLCIEMLAFVLGLTMFDSNSALLSVTGHATSSIFLTGLILNGWQCDWFWMIFSFGSVLPFAYDTIISMGILIGRKY